jgi:sec-independent protein translocase protein TatA
MGSMPGNIGPLEIGIVLVIALIVFGPKRLPELGRGLGRGIGEKADDDDDEVKTLSPTQATAAASVDSPAEAEVAPDKRS